MNWRDTLKEDLHVFRLVHQEPGLMKYFYYPDCRAVVIFRLSQLFYRSRITRPLSYFMTMLNDFVNGVWIGPRVKVGPGLFLGHPRGLVVNPTASIGRNCSILQRVTIGGPNVTIGDNVEINAGAQIISNARGKRCLAIGDNVIIGAGSMIVKDVPSCSIAVGVPGKVIKQLDPSEVWIEIRKKQ